MIQVARRIWRTGAGRGIGWAPGMVALAALLSAAPLNAQNSQDFLLLPELRFLHQRPGPDGEVDEDTRASLDLLYARNFGRLRFFGEAILTNEKSDLARLHIGYETEAGTRFQLGRFQLNQGYWNKTFHFRNYIQPSIIPPGIESYEDEGGSLPVHFSGLNLRQTWMLDADASLVLEAGFGAGTRKIGRRLDPHDLTDPTGGRKPSTSLRLTWTPNEDEGTEFGLFLVDNRIPARSSRFVENHQRIGGAFANYEQGALRLYGTWYLVNNRMEFAADNRRSRFHSTWLETDYQLTPHWMPYLRYEFSNGNASDTYLSDFAGFVRKRRLAGLRWDLLDNQALKLEYADTDFLHENSRQWALQWSMIFP